MTRPARRRRRILGFHHSQTGNPMESKRLEQLDQGLHRALAMAQRDESATDGALSPDHPAVTAAQSCEVMLPEVLTLASLVDTLRHKIETVQVLLERARAHEALPPEAQLAANEGYLAVDDLIAKPAP
jgi:hypothetical protein